MFIKTVLIRLFAVAVGMACVSSTAFGALIFSGSNGSGLSASATFSTFSGSGCSSSLCLHILLQNTGDPAHDPADALTALFFNLPGNLLLSSDSAVLGLGSIVLNGGTTNYSPSGLNAADGVGVVGGEWEYLNGLNQYGANEGVSSTGLGIFGSPSFPGSNLQDPTALDGVEYGIVNGQAANANKGLTSQGLISNSVLFTLDSLPVGFDLAGITHVTFQYGTALTEPHISSGPPISRVTLPEPESLALIAIGMLSLVFARRKLRS